MQRRPWPLVILALLQIFGPLGSIALSAYLSKAGFFDMAAAIWKYSRPIDLMEFYALPVAQGVLIFLAKRFGYFIVIALAFFSIYLNILEWRVAKDLISLPILFAVTGVNLALIFYLLLPNVRAVFMNPRLRWWENAPRYVVSIIGQVSKTDGHANRCSIVDLSIGGAGIQTESAVFTNGDTAILTWELQDRTILLRGTVVYGRSTDSQHRYGIEWQRSIEEDERQLSRYIAILEANNTPVNRPPPSWSDDFKAWWGRAKKSPAAWTPEVPKKK